MLSATRQPRRPAFAGKTLAVLRGNLAPNGAVMKSSAANPRYLKTYRSRHRVRQPCGDERRDRRSRPGRHGRQRAGAAQCRSGGCTGHAGMGQSADPKKLLKQGVRDMVRICDGRMSGTHYGTCILHVAPEAAVGGPLGLLKTGDLVELDVEAAASTCGSMWPNWNAAGRSGSRLLPSTDAPLRRCTSAMSRRPMKAATSTS